MRLITAEELKTSPTGYREIAQALNRGGLVCFPAESTYRLACDLMSDEAVTRLLQSKRRSEHHPALVFVTDVSMLRRVVADVPPWARRLAEVFWPGLLTLVLDIHPDLPPKVARTLARATGKVGVRVPASPIAYRVVREFGGPLLVSSANLERRSGASSAAQVKKNFHQRVAVFVDAGDLPSILPSTLVEADGEGYKVTREGAIPESRVAAALGQVVP